MSEELVTIEINLEPETIDEGYLSALGGQMQILLQTMFGGGVVPTRVRGSKGSVSSFARALGNEKKYIEALTTFGLTDSRTLGNRHKLEKAIAGFERTTGIKWPFK
jgi:hypothetical protein|tara:strand:+ start:877 stop:1194 length:318 start_codon:yes stop_codon:yes gene_type:complete